MKSSGHLFTELFALDINKLTHKRSSGKKYTKAQSHATYFPSWTLSTPSTVRQNRAVDSSAGNPEGVWFIFLYLFQIPDKQNMAAWWNKCTWFSLRHKSTQMWIVGHMHVPSWSDKTSEDTTYWTRPSIASLVITVIATQLLKQIWLMCWPVSNRNETWLLASTPVTCPQYVVGTSASEFASPGHLINRPQDNQVIGY